MKFTKCEEIVLKEVLLGKSTRDIADTLCVTESAVKWHLTNLFKKEQVKSRYELINKYTDPNFEVN
jgi:DNA-binding NarL/FixJ family response regulator